MPESEKSILFVCLGNICRSPAAEGVMRELVHREGLDGTIRIDSAGTCGYHIGNPADRRMREAAEGGGLKLTSRSRMVTPDDFSNFDMIVAMDRENYRDLIRMADGHRDKIRMLSDFLDDDWPREVPDPYYGGQDGFAQVLDMLEAAGPKLLEELKS